MKAANGREGGHSLLRDAKLCQDARNVMAQHLNGQQSRCGSGHFANQRHEDSCTFHHVIEACEERHYIYIIYEHVAQKCE